MGLMMELPNGNKICIDETCNSGRLHGPNTSLLEYWALIDGQWTKKLNEDEIETMTEESEMEELAEWYGREDIWNAVSFITASHYRVLAMKELDNRPQTPTDISNNTDIPHVSHVSRALTELKEEGLAELLVSEDVRKGRIHGITDIGREALHKAEWLGDDE